MARIREGIITAFKKLVTVVKKMSLSINANKTNEYVPNKTAGMPSVPVTKFIYPGLQINIVND